MFNPPCQDACRQKAREPGTMTLPPPVPLCPREQPAIDRDRLIRLYADLGGIAADRVICRAMEDLAIRLARTERARREGDARKMLREARGAASVADQLGMVQVARIARDLSRLAGTPDTTAIAAVAARLDRLGEACLAAVWEAEGLSL
jgi:hypothetical protein